MESINDLLVNEGQKIANFAKLFTRLPEILQAIASADTHKQEVETQVEALMSEYSDIEGKIVLAEMELKAVQGQFALIEAEVNKAKNKAKEEIAKMDRELERARKANNDAVESSIDLMKYEMGKHQEVIAKSQKAAEDEIAKLKISVDFWAKAEMEAMERAAKAQNDLNALIDRIKLA